MDWNPNNSTWVPQDYERPQFHDIYMDESSKSHRFLILGGLIIPYAYAGLFQNEITAIRATTNTPIALPDGKPNEMKWEYVSNYSLDAYKKVVKATIDFRTRFKSSLHEMALHCASIDTSRKPLRKTGNGDRQTGFEIEFYFLCNAVIANRYNRFLFSLYPDRDLGRRELRTTREILNYGAYGWGDKRTYPFRRVEFADPESCQALQVVDIFMGALAYRQNRHYDKPEASRAKKMLCDYIWEQGHLGDPFDTSPYQKKRAFMTWVIRPAPDDSKARSGPQNMH